MCTEAGSIAIKVAHVTHRERPEKHVFNHIHSVAAICGLICCHFKKKLNMKYKYSFK
jgi:hypothetical protein